MLVCTGAILIAIFGAIPEPAHSLDQLLELLGRRAFILWMIGQAVAVGIIIVTASCFARIATISSKPRVRLLRGLAYGSISGILSAHSLLVAKSAVELLVRTVVDSVNQFNKWQAWIILLGFVFLALTQLYYLHQGLKLVSTSVLYPLVFCIYNIIAILDGLIYFRQTDQLTLLHGLLIGLGTAILLSGVLALSWRLSDDQTPAPVAQSALAPGLGFVEDTDNEYEDLSTADEAVDIGREHERLLNGGPMTPTTKLDTVLGATRNVRKTVRLTEADEIWGELEDDSSKSPSTQRAGSITKSYIPDGPQSDADEPDETTSLIRPSSRQFRRRRRSTGFPGFTARPSPREGRRKTVDRKRSLGDLFKLRWWQGSDGAPSNPNTSHHDEQSGNDGAIV